MPPLKVLLISAHPLWVQVYGQVLENLPCKPVIIRLVLNNSLTRDLVSLLALPPDIVLVCLDNPAGDLSIVRAVRTLDLQVPVMVLCSQYQPPRLEELEDAGVQSIASSRMDLTEVAALLYAVVDGRRAPLGHQYLQITCRQPTPHVHELLNARERDILRLVANDLTDHEIATYLGVSVRTINSQLHLIYAKLGVRGRAGAVALAFVKGLLPPGSLGSGS